MGNPSLLEIGLDVYENLWDSPTKMEEQEARVTQDLGKF